MFDLASEKEVQKASTFLKEINAKLKIASGWVRLIMECVRANVNMNCPHTTCYFSGLPLCSLLSSLVTYTL